MGADRGILVKTDTCFTDSMETSRLLHQAIETDGSPDLIFTGKQSIDTEWMQIPSRLSSLFDLPVVVNVVVFSMAGGTVTVEREMERSGSLPGVAPEDSLTFGIPNCFEHVAAEHRAAREAVVLIDQSSFSKFEVAGNGALSFLNSVATNNVDRPVGSTIYPQLCNDRCGIEADITISRVVEDRFFAITGTAFGVHDFMWLKRHLPQDGSVSLRVVTSSFAMINICGPLSHNLLMRVSDDDFRNEGFAFGQCREVVIGYAPVLAIRVTYIGELCYELYMPPEYAAGVYEMLWDAGQDLGIRNAGYRAIDSLRLEKGYCYWGAEVSPDYSPYGTGLGFAVNLDKGAFVGRDAAFEAPLRSGAQEDFPLG
jgi:4-methylaminobutanoate oxidase (formaldehyde-forming)